ncbi:MAG: TPM domain-containing protein [Alphaproteobacteria bacterium]|nr:TPM domain-containing protein [Alphaproteobacteria bacterium]
MVILTEEEHARVSQAVKDVERQTSGEIHCVVCRQSDDYFLAAGFVLACTAIGITFLISWLSFRFWLDIDPTILSMIQVLAFVAGLGVIRLWPSLCLRLVPKSLRYRRAHANAVRQFLAHNIHATENRTGVLVFVSLAERYAEIIADSGLSAHIDQAEWNRIIGDLTVGVSHGRIADALIEAVQQSGLLLVRHYRAGPENRNELPDHVVEI